MSTSLCKRYPKDLYITLTGKYNVGKHALIYQASPFSPDSHVPQLTISLQFVMDAFLTPRYYDPTGPADFRKQIMVDDQLHMLEISDPDMSDCVPLRAKRLRHSDGIIIMYDICDRDSFEFAKAAWKEARMLRFELEKANASGPIPILLLGNKSDRESERVVSQDEGKALARKLCTSWAECSCMHRTGVVEAFQGLVRLMRQNIERGEQKKEEKQKVEKASARRGEDCKSRAGQWGRWRQIIAWRIVGVYSISGKGY